MSQEKSKARTIYNSILEEYKAILDSYSEEEKRIASKIRETLYSIKLPFEFNDAEVINDIESVITPILKDGTYAKESLSKIMPLILLREEKSSIEQTNRGNINVENTLRSLFLNILLEKKLIDPNYVFSNGSTLFHILAICDKDDPKSLFKIAIKHNCNINLKDNKGNTILHLALSNPYSKFDFSYVNNEDFLNIIVNDFNFNAENNDGLNVFDYFQYILKNVSDEIYQLFDNKINGVEETSEEEEWHNALSNFHSALNKLNCALGYPAGLGFKNLIRYLIPETRACFIDEKELTKILDIENFSIEFNRLNYFLNFNNTEYKLYKPNGNDTKENLRNQIDTKQNQIMQQRKVILGILKDCFPGYEDEVLNFIISGTITPAFHIIYTTLLTNHITEINSELLMLPLTPDKTFLTFVELFRLECGCNKEIGDKISRKLEATSKQS